MLHQPSFQGSWLLLIDPIPAGKDGQAFARFPLHFLVSVNRLFLDGYKVWLMDRREEALVEAFDPKDIVYAPKSFQNGN